MRPFVEIMDSTLRDGEQTSGVSFLPHEKLIIARMLLNDLNVDRIEVASARVSEGEKEAVGMICRYAAKIDKLEHVEVLGFVDGGQSVDWILSCGGKTINLLAKGSLRHCQEQLKKTPEARVVAFVHGETSTGVVSDAKTLAAVAHKYDCLTIVDAVTSLAGVPVLAKEWDLDAVYSAGQKCLSCTPGLSPSTFNQRVIDYVTGRKDKIQSWFMDMTMILEYWGKTVRTYHHTAPINGLYALHEALLMLKEEGLENVWARHRSNYEALRDGLEAMGLEFLVKEEDRLPQISTVKVPEGVSEPQLRAELLKMSSLEIGAGLGPLAGKVWRFGLMGQTSRPDYVLTCLASMEKILPGLGYPVKEGVAVAAAHRRYAAQHTAAAGKALA